MKVHPDQEGRILNYVWCSVMYVGILKNVSSRVKFYFEILGCCSQRKSNRNLSNSWDGEALYEYDLQAF